MPDARPVTVYRTPKSPYWQYDFQFRGKRYYGSTSCTSERAAEEFERRERQRAALPALARPPLTISEAASLYQDQTEHQPSWPTTRYILAAAVKGLGQARLLSSIGQRDLQAFTARRRHGRSNATVNRELEVLRAMWRHADRLKFDIGEMPDWRALRLKVASTPPGELAPELDAKLLAAIRPDVRDAVQFLLLTGWRRNEVLHLRWSDLNLPRKQALTRIKGGDTVTRPLTTAMVELIARQPVTGPWVWTYLCSKTKARSTTRKGITRPARLAGERYPLTPTVLRETFEAARQAIGQPQLRIHDLRHTRASRITRETRDITLTQAALQHRHIATTMRYSHVLDEDLRAGLEASESRNSPGITTPEKKKA